MNTPKKSARKPRKNCTVNPLRMSQPIGAALAFLGVDRSMPLLHGSQGCTAFGMVLFVRHFRESIPMQTTAMNEVTTILGGYDNLEQAILNIHQRARPALIGIASTGLTETKGDDVEGYLKLIRAAHPELEGTELVYASTPDYIGSLQDGWARAVTSLVRLAEPGGEPIGTQVNVLVPAHATAADVDEVREIVESFGLLPIMLPDISGSLDGHVPENFAPHTDGGTSVDAIRAMGRSGHTLAIGRQMWPAAMELEMHAGVPYTVFDSLVGLANTDRFVRFLMDYSGRPAPKRLRRARSQCEDAMLDAHFHFSGKRVAIAGEVDLLADLCPLLARMGAHIPLAVAPVDSPLLTELPADETLVGDLEDLEAGASGCDVLLTHSHGRQAAGRLGIPLFRVGIPCFDRLGATHRRSFGYRGSRDFLFTLGNLFLEHQHEARRDDWPAASLSCNREMPHETPASPVPCH